MHIHNSIGVHSFTYAFLDYCCGYPAYNHKIILMTTSICYHVFLIKTNMKYDVYVVLGDPTFPSPSLLNHFFFKFTTHFRKSGFHFLQKLSRVVKRLCRLKSVYQQWLTAICSHTAHTEYLPCSFLIIDSCAVQSFCNFEPSAHTSILSFN